MMPKGLFSQLALIVLSLGIIFTYVKPALGELESVQNSIAVYQAEQQKVSEVNAKLNQVAEVLNSIDAEDSKRLLTYMPDEVDSVAVARDIKQISDSAGVLLKQIKYIGPEKKATTDAYVDPLLAVVPVDTIDPEAHFFSVEFESSYEQMKQILRSFEQNAYPLEVHDLNIKRTEGGFLFVTIKLVTYDRVAPAFTSETQEITP